MLAVGALVASILAVGTGAVSAQPGSTITAADPNHNPDAGADWSACVGAAGTHDAAFSDVSEDSVHADAINCIAHYGITLGIGDGLYGPDSHVTAFQMRLFVQRAADLMGANGEKVLAGVELKDPVTRLNMAQLMFRLVDDIDADVRISPADGQVQFYDADTNAWTVVDDYFDDAKKAVPIFDSQVVGAAYELGITRGTRGDGTLVSTAGSTFEPFENVSRAQMASFIARTLDHSNLRPAGMSIQRNSNQETMVSYRDAAFAPIKDARIDVFSALYPDDAFDEDDGECEAPNFVKDETLGQTTCEIDRGDHLTDDDGNVELTLASDADPLTAACTTGPTAALRFESAPGSAGRTHWAWTGDLGDEVDEDTDLQKLEDVARPVGRAGPDYARLTGGLPTDDELAKMGETVTFTLQLYSDVRGRDGTTQKDDAAVGPDRSRNPYHLRIQKYHVARTAADGTRDTAGEALTDSDHGSDSGESKSGTASTGTGLFQKAPGDWDYVDATGTATVTAAAAKPFNTPVDTVVSPNSDGELVITLTNIDLNAAPAVDNTDVGVHFTLTPFIAKNDHIDANLVTEIEAKGNYVTHTDDVATAGNVDVASGHVIFSDDASDPHAVSGETAKYRIIAGSSSGNSVTVKVVDQYGDGMRNVAVNVSSALDAAGPLSDRATYPEEVDVTVQSTENRNGDTTVGDTSTLVTRSSLTYATYVAAVAADPSATPPVAAAAAKVTVDSRAVTRNPGTVPDDDVEGVFHTRRDGTYRIGYTYNPGNDANTARTESITPESIEVKSWKWVRSAPDTPIPAAIADRTQANVGIETTREHEQGSNVSVYWAKTGNSLASSGGRSGATDFLPVLVPDVPSRTIVVNEPGAETDADNPMAYFYDEDDNFIIAGVAATFEMFEEALKATYKDDKIYVDYIKWRNYVVTRPGRVNRTAWELTLSCTPIPAAGRSLVDGNAWS